MKINSLTVTDISKIALQEQIELIRSNIHRERF